MILFRGAVLLFQTSSTWPSYNYHQTEALHLQSLFPSFVRTRLCSAVNSVADYNAAGALNTARSGSIARRPSMKRRHSFDFSRRKAVFLTAPGRRSLDVSPRAHAC